MARIFCIPGVLLLFTAFALNFIVSISLPYLPAIDITRTHFGDTTYVADRRNTTQIRFGVWTPCYYDDNGHTCLNLGYAYNITATNADASEVVSITSAWTRGLAIHPVATAVSLFATILALSEHVTVALFATLTAWLASTITLIAFLVDVALYAWTKHQFKKLGVDARTRTAPGFWLAFIAFLMLFVGGLATCFGRIKDRRASRPAAKTDAVESVDAKGSEITEKPAPATESKFGLGKLKFGKKSQA